MLVFLLWYRFILDMSNKGYTVLRVRSVGMRSLIVFGMGLVCMTLFGMDQQAQPHAAVMGNHEQQYLLPGNIQEEQQEAYRHDQRGCCRKCCRQYCDMHGAKVGVCCCVLCAVGVGVGLGYLLSCDAVQPIFDSVRDFLEWIRA
jgi:hypothetical protein